MHGPRSRYMTGLCWKASDGLYKRMKSRPLFFSCLVVAILHIPDRTCGQFNDPRNYENTPVGTNQLEVGYAYVHANASLDTSLIVAGARLNLDQGFIDYTRYFG